MTESFIKMAHGSGGQSTSELIAGIFAKYFHNEYLDAMGDAAVVPGSGRIAMTTDSFVVTRAAVLRYFDSQLVQFEESK